MSKQNGVESKVREIRRKTRRQYSAEEKIRIVLEGLRGEESIATLCRDGSRYNPYQFDLTVESLKASTTLEVGEAWCVAKTALLAACCRVLGIPTRVGYADVRNHLTTERMREKMKTDVFHWQGYTSIYLDRKWDKATPAFNIELCEKFRLKPLEFNGLEDSIFHSFDLDGHRHMQYLRFRGDYDEVPLEEMRESFAEILGFLEFPREDAGFHLDVDKETAGKQ